MRTGTQPQSQEMRDKRIKGQDMDPLGLLASKMIRLWGKKGFKGGWDLPERGWVWAGTHGHSGGRVIIFWWFGDQARYLARDTSTRRHNQQLKKEKSDSNRTIGQDKQQATSNGCTMQRQKSGRWRKGQRQGQDLVSAERGAVSWQRRCSIACAMNVPFLKQAASGDVRRRISSRDWGFETVGVLWGNDAVQVRAVHYLRISSCARGYFH